MTLVATFGTKFGLGYEAINKPLLLFKLGASHICQLAIIASQGCFIGIPLRNP